MVKNISELILIVSYLSVWFKVKVRAIWKLFENIFWKQNESPK